MKNTSHKSSSSDHLEGNCENQRTRPSSRSWSYFCSSFNLKVLTSTRAHLGAAAYQRKNMPLEITNSPHWHAKEANICNLLGKIQRETFSCHNNRVVNIFSASLEINMYPILLLYLKFFFFFLRFHTLFGP